MLIPCVPPQFLFLKLALSHPGIAKLLLKVEAMKNRTVAEMKIISPEKEKGKKIVIIVGGGFGGLNAAKRLASKEGLHVLLFDHRNLHLFQPLLYQVATAGLNPSDIAVPIRAQFTDVPNVEVHLLKLTGVNLIEKHVIGVTPRGSVEIDFDYLILACGARHSYFGHPEWEEFAPGLKTLEQATEIRRRLLLAYELAENELDPTVQNALLTFIIVGAGPTGVELAGAISDISRTVLVRDFKRIDPSRSRVLLLEAGPRILSSFHEDLSARAVQYLKELGVEVRTAARVDNITAHGVQIGSEFIASENVFWAAGVQAASMDFTPSVAKDRAGRIFVEKDFSLPQYPEVFVIGDMAAFESAPGRLLPGLAPAAIQAGRFVGDTILADQRGEKRTEFKYKDKGQLATIGKSRGILEVGRIKMGGLLAWLAWLFVHIFYLIGFRNRISVMWEWMWSYLFSKRNARLIGEKEWRFKDQK